MIETIDKDLDVRERWAGIRSIKSKYRPQPYNRTDKYGGKHVHMKERAEKKQQNI